MKQALEMQLEALMQIHREILADADEHGQKQEWWDSLNRSVADIEALREMIEKCEDTEPIENHEYWVQRGLDCRDEIIEEE